MRHRSAGPGNLCAVQRDQREADAQTKKLRVPTNLRASNVGGEEERAQWLSALPDRVRGRDRALGAAARRSVRAGRQLLMGRAGNRRGRA